MKVLNLIWGFGVGGICKCYQTYARLGEIEPKLHVVNACVFIRECSSGRSALEQAGVHIIDIGHRLDFSWVRRINKLIDEEHIDLVFTHGFNGPVVAVICGLLGGTRVPIACSYHGEYYAPTKCRKLIAPIFNFVAHFIYRHWSIGVIVCAVHCKHFLVEHAVPERKICVVYNGITDRPRPSVERTKFEVFRGWIAGRILVGIASRLEHIKGLDVLIRSLALIKESGRVDVCAVLIGEGPERKKLEAMVGDRGLNDSVYFAGSRNDVREWLSILDIFVLPSRFENHSIGLLEAMRDGKAIICSGVGGNCESVRDGQEGAVVPADDAEALARAIERLAINENTRRILGENARRRYLDLFTEEKMLRGIADWLLEVGA